jgi:hypothetical protein
MAPKLHTTGQHVDTPNDREEKSSRQSTADSIPRPEAFLLVWEQMDIINARLDAHGIETTARNGSS